MLGIVMMIAMSAVAGVPEGWTARTWAHEQLLDCWGRVANKTPGYWSEAPPRVEARVYRLARTRCAREIRRYRSLVGQRAFDRDWRALADDWQSTD